MKKKIAAIGLAGVLMLGLTGCTGGQYKRNSGYMNEWISPDGVHYWVYSGYMAPRYNHEGNLVIENWDVQ